MLNGIGASQGYGIGKAVIIKDANLDYSSVKYTSSDNEKKRLHSALSEYTNRTNTLISNLKKHTGEKESQILEGHLMMLKDPAMVSGMEQNIMQGCTAEKSVDVVCSGFIDVFSNVDDELTRQRASDVKDIKNSLLSILLGVESVDISSVEKGSILVANDFTPSMTSRIKRENVEALITQTGSVTSHSAILARAMGIPAVLSVSDATHKIKNSDMIIVDGFKGKIIVNPSFFEREAYAKRQKDYIAERASLNEYFSKPAITKDGVEKKVYANIGTPDDVANAVHNGAQGIGLFRTEFLFMGRESQPDEEEQFEAYSTVAKAMEDKEVIIRTLDIGGDKAIDYLDIKKEENPFLGNRAIRYCLNNRQIFKTQLCAILRAAVYGNIKIMLPLVTCVDEIRQAKQLITECENELQKKRVNYKSVPLGVMIETPAAAVISDLLAQEVDFFSIGTNDLTGYIMAVDRGNADVNYLYDVLELPVLRTIETIIKNAKNAGITVGMCGEAAADGRIIPKLVEWGLDEFSVSPSSILQTKKNICNC